MRQYIKQHTEIIVIAFALVLAMLFQYLRISSLDIAFLFESTAPTFYLYTMVLIAIPAVVLFFVFLPLLFITEVTYKFTLPKPYTITISRVVYNINIPTSNDIRKPKETTVLRC